MIACLIFPISDDILSSVVGIRAILLGLVALAFSQSIKVRSGGIGLTIGIEVLTCVLIVVGSVFAGPFVLMIVGTHDITNLAGEHGLVANIALMMTSFLEVPIGSMGASMRISPEVIVSIMQMAMQIAM